MFKQNKKIVLLFSILMLGVLTIQYILPKPADFSRNYLSRKKTPFGCYAIFRLLQGVYANEVRTSSQTIYNINSLYTQKTSLLIVNDRLNLNRLDAGYLYRFLKRGNTVFLAADDFSGVLNDSLHLRTQSLYYNFSESPDSLLIKHGVNINFCSSDNRQKTFSYPRLASASYFQNFDSTRFKIVAMADSSKACLIKTKVGAGTLYLMSMPDIFGNYFIVNNNTRTVAYTMLSLLHNSTLLWDEYYKTYNVSNYSPLKFILESDALYSAYLLAIFAIIIYMIFEGRRRQRLIPIVEAPANSTLEFINVVSHVYYNSKNHRNIAVEKIKYFYEMLRKKFGIATGEINEALYDEVAELSGIATKTVRQLFVFCERIKGGGEISEYELLELNRQIDNFNKKSLR